jgi:hypothetical protein
MQEASCQVVDKIIIKALEGRVAGQQVMLLLRESISRHGRRP